MDRRTGTLVWQHDTREEGGPFEFHGDPLVTGTLVVVGSDRRQPGSVAYLYAFDRETGEVRWKVPVGSGVASDIPSIGKVVYGVTFADELLALDAQSGTRLWAFSTGATNDSFRLTSSPAVAGPLVFFGGLDGAVRAFDGASGILLWKRDLAGPVSTGIAVGENAVYVGTSQGHLYRLLPGSGDVAAQVKTEGSPTGRLALADGCLLAFLGERTLTCYEPSLERVRWEHSEKRSWKSSRPYGWRGIALAGTETGELLAFRLTDGTIAWSERFSGTIRGIGVSPEALYVGTLKGEVHARPWPAGGKAAPQR